jgi:hypothetical protein
VARLFISELERLLGHDPSISLHDDWQTTSVIAADYSDYGRGGGGSGGGSAGATGAASKPVYLFEVSIPVVESIGWTLQEVALMRPQVIPRSPPDHPPWFNFNGVWFDGRARRTERYSLYGVPFLSQRLHSLRQFETMSALQGAVSQFRTHQSLLHADFERAAQSSASNADAGTSSAGRKRTAPQQQQQQPGTREKEAKRARTAKKKRTKKSKLGCTLSFDGVEDE